jgi:acyl phosphate:glycerol-3-phosphate acyltransferase
VVISWLGSIIAAYLLGSIPSGLLIGRLVFGIDIRKYGSQRTGATNVLRTLGKRAAIVALLMDAGKGVLAVLLAQAILPGEPWAHVAAALAVAAGHNWPLFVGFRGGRGVIVSAAVLGVMNLWVLAGTVVVGLALIWRTRYVSLGSVVGSSVSPLIALFFYLRGEMPLPYLVYTILGAALIVAVHRDNIRRLLQGTENRLGQRVHTAV